jgi:acetyltransferase-like isoleucine patch superfamily enzyme
MNFKIKIKKRLYKFLDNYSNEKKLIRLQNLIDGFKYLGNGFRIGDNYSILNQQYIEIGNNFLALERFRMEAWDNYSGENFDPVIKIGDNVIFNNDIHIGCINKIIIGNNCLFASRIFITDHEHGNTTKEMLSIPPSERKLISKGPVIIGDNVWVGEGVAILPNVTIGRNCIIGTNSVVTKSIPENSVAAGIPAKVIKKIV